MIFQKKYTGFAIAIAWPETYCKQPGDWYDDFINHIGISKHHYYKVGHAALVLVNEETKKCHYFDFGRYHSPFQTGRVRSEITDDGLRIKTVAKISDDGLKIKNFEEILNELQLNLECHGEGAIHASYGKIDFSKAFDKATRMQQISPIHYGPFCYKGSNCSRFVNSAIRAGKPKWLSAFKLNFFVPLTPTPLNNVNSFGNRIILEKLLTNAAFCPTPISDKKILKKTLPEPARPKEISNTAQWLSGEGSGSWFEIQLHRKDRYIISMFDPNGILECGGEFTVKNKEPFNIKLPYSFEYLSHCQSVKIRQGKNIVEFTRKEKLQIRKNILPEVSNKRRENNRDSQKVLVNQRELETI